MRGTCRGGGLEEEQRTSRDGAAQSGRSRRRGDRPREGRRCRDCRCSCSGFSVSLLLLLWGEGRQRMEAMAGNTALKKRACARAVCGTATLLCACKICATVDWRRGRGRRAAQGKYCRAPVSHDTLSANLTARSSGTRMKAQGLTGEERRTLAREARRGAPQEATLIRLRC